MAKKRVSRKPSRAASDFASVIAVGTRPAYFRKSEIVALYPGLAPGVAPGPSGTNCTVFLSSGAAIAVIYSPEDILPRL